MYNRYFFILLLTVAFLGCSNDHLKDEEAIDLLMQNQQEAWNNGDLKGFMFPYDQSDSLMFIGKRGITRGWQNTLDNYIKGYPDQKAMGRLQFTNVTKEMLSDSSAFVIGKWELFRSEDTLSGHYSLIWKKKKGEWKIVADHSS